MPAHAAPAQPQIIATSGAALQSFSSLISSSTRSHVDLNSSERNMEQSSSSPHRSRPRNVSHFAAVGQSSCQESYRLFKLCSRQGETEGFSCSDAVASYMRCALNGC
mmetsp:Transcript_7747/g.12439  ORF Transcript_7747/g.12439 Transcript_7747/m.12439 type:complete len:107 (-) Transcript_7747:279-599(-)|eukprot:CAMPEP_0201886820 /NCGR_PEP_ID=MMETSP0902-20130614/23258_1 /ASSEMBLY_ACC=CAM_ASM_000551 /TAXON_ID=420261 /ORGANISM="Thalassiosira antarctica, Strain CCMP982" /LENGTH=106 /DNA_ID=CAMNT_0048416543 /DNA_START=30 /DNA_END=350 /DNA_ORIENTATION=-